MGRCFGYNIEENFRDEMDKREEIKKYQPQEANSLSHYPSHTLSPHTSSSN